MHHLAFEESSSFLTLANRCINFITKNNTQNTIDKNLPKKRRIQFVLCFSIVFTYCRFLRCSVYF